MRRPSSLRRDRRADLCYRYNDQHSKLIKEFMNRFNPTGAEPVPSELQQPRAAELGRAHAEPPKLTLLPRSDSAAIYVADANGTYLSGFNENVTIPFEAGKTYRLRIINQCSFRTVDPPPNESLTLTLCSCLRHVLRLDRWT